MIHVLTGGPNSGKTTLINELSGRGFHTIPEGSRRVLEYHIDDQLSIDSIQNLILDYQLQLEGSLPRESPFTYIVSLDNENYTPQHTILDRSLIDVLAYSRVLSDDTRFHDNIKRRIDQQEDVGERYDRIWLCRSRGYNPDGVRVEKDKEQIDRIEKEIVDAYKEYGYGTLEMPTVDNDIKGELEQRVKLLTSS
jgi:predicted ATPase